MNRLLEDKTYYFINKEIEIVYCQKKFNVAIVRYVNSLKEFVVDMNFLETEPSKESFISIKQLTGR